MKKITTAILLSAMMGFSSCESYLDILPDDKITSETFWTTPEDATLALNGIYSVLRSTNVYGYGGGMDACTPNAYQWAHWEGQQMQVMVLFFLDQGELYQVVGKIVIRAFIVQTICLKI